MENRVSNDQLDLLLDFLAEHPALAKGVGLGVRSKENVDKQWSDLATQLNSFGCGSSKSVDRWKKYWADIKHKTKVRLAKRRRDARGGFTSQDDLSDTEKKILGIIGEQAVCVYGDAKHRVPVFNIDPLTPQRDYIMVQQEIITPNDMPEEYIRDIKQESPEPSRNGQTCRVSLECPPAAANIETKPQHVPQPPQNGVEIPVNRFRYDRLRARRMKPNITSIPSRIEPQWVMDLERRRVEAEKKMADAALMMAESARAQADVAAMQADTIRTLVGLVRRQHEDIRALLAVTPRHNAPPDDDK